MVLLDVQSLVKQFGGVMANDYLDLSIEEGEIVGLIGPNGAGKTTLMHCIAGYHRPDRGTVRFAGVDITGWPPHRTARAGIARTFQSLRTMEGLTVEENVMVGAFCRTDDPDRAREAALALLERLDLAGVRGAQPHEIPLAWQRRVELARALATRPRLLMLDEAAAGLSPEEIRAFEQLLRALHRELGLTLIVVEHVMDFVMSLAGRVVVLASGRKIAEGRPEEVARDEQVIEAYLGGSYARGPAHLGGV
ncbi:ABC transporter ATP-binding protein [Carboxydochorda subterranea]|uniref:ABC transporter ATP-binding protein n=1 Tax=Carboxydichorda subterranea TaxID=3109565 RepID=A0ABZ1BYZ7_9FIRM|nr:ABC transporter ATP-binding protein [Limnochorda sp. L945t]WRP17946.1 ABC transporter ATP-binding protein [Limnochorda sp. L945t]